MNLRMIRLMLVFKELPGGTIRRTKSTTVKLKWRRKSLKMRMSLWLMKKFMDPESQEAEAGLLRVSLISLQRDQAGLAMRILVTQCLELQSSSKKD
jgi:hypothetical protein